jgi:anti-sigma factor ChrR (cupin superfamily)
MGTPKDALILKGLLGLASTLNEAMRWENLRDGVNIHWLYRSGPDGPSAALIKFDPGAKVPLHEHGGYEHIYVLSGSQMDQNGFLETGALMIHPPGSRHSVVSEEGCVVLAIYERPVKFLDS